MKSLKKKTLVKKQGGGPFSEKKPTLNKVTPAQSKATGAKVGEEYRKAPIKGDTINAPIRQKLSDYATRGPEPKEYTKYQELTRAASKPAMKKGGSMSKMTMMKKGGAMKVSTIKKKK